MGRNYRPRVGAYARAAALKRSGSCQPGTRNKPYITSWLRKGIRVHVVQRMAGHKHLATTEKYVHLLNVDLEEAARILGNILETEPEAAE